MAYMWDIKFNQEDYLYGKNPNKFIENESLNFEKKSKVICFGEGEGRNAIFLAKNGFDVTALDPSNIGLEKAKKLANKNGVDIQIEHSFVENYKGKQKFKYAICTFMHVPEESRKDVFKTITESLESGGLFVAEFFSKNQLQYKSGGPKDLNLLYSAEEMKALFESFNNCNIIKCDEVITELNEGVGHQGEASVVQIILEKI